ncbi:hypothetical protein CJD_1608 [Clostridium perfringens D str. JGS1721]|uniref:Uncharacterized protein n=1 Tax=Clostridium perfringens D str. JGS1721 TaxID=488537 RepID=B1V542_CLOPF|nr:hypothetical protein CJD_1608 [Clostridium perfringens D str. JGS1721]
MGVFILSIIILNKLWIDNNWINKVKKLIIDMNKKVGKKNE